MAVLQAVPASADGDDADPDAAEIARLAAVMPADETQLLYSLCLHGRAELGLAPDEYAALTMVLLRLLAFKPAAPRAPAEKKTLTEPATRPRRYVAAQRRRWSVETALRAGRETPTQPAVAAPVRAPSHPVAPVPSPAFRPPAPPGQRLPVVAPASSGPGARRLAVQVDADIDDEAGAVVAVPVRQQPEQREPAPSTVPVVVPTEEGDFWHSTVQQLVAAESVTALVRELALQSQLVARDTGHWMLRVERESLNQPTSRERLQNAPGGRGHAVKLGVEIGRVTDSPARRNAQAAAERQRAAEEVILDDPFVQSMMRDFGAKIVPGSIKPLLTQPIQGRNSMFNKGQLAGLMKQAQAMQDNLKKAQDELAFVEVTGESGAGLVKVTMTCKHDVKRITIDPSLLADDKDMLEDLVAAAFNAAVRKAEETSQEKMGKLTAGMPGLPGGMKFPF